MDLLLDLNFQKKEGQGVKQHGINVTTKGAPTEENVRLP